MQNSRFRICLPEDTGAIRALHQPFSGQDLIQVCKWSRIIYKLNRVSAGTAFRSSFGVKRGKELE